MTYDAGIQRNESVCDHHEWRDPLDAFSDYSRHFWGQKGFEVMHYPWNSWLYVPYRTETILLLRNRKCSPFTLK